MVGDYIGIRRLLHFFALILDERELPWRTGGRGRVASLFAVPFRFPILSLIPITLNQVHASVMSRGTRLYVLRSEMTAPGHTVDVASSCPHYSANDLGRDERSSTVHRSRSRQCYRIPTICRLQITSSHARLDRRLGRFDSQLNFLSLSFPFGVPHPRCCHLFHSTKSFLRDYCCCGFMARETSLDQN
jgi:hypothetical protein